jgi:hypothetical protein
MNFKELYQIAKASLEELKPLDEADFRLEQAEYNEKDETWDIVVSFLVENTNMLKSKMNLPRASLKFERIYKKLKIDKNKIVKGLYMYENA